MPVGQHLIALPARYRVVRHIANGGMASVWAAQDELLGRLVAVKVLSPAYAEDERANRRFLREARAGARLSECRHVVTVYDIGEHDGRPFMVMEYLAGGTVADRMRSGREIPQALALRWLHEAGDALDCAHGHDVVHRDVKPANLLIDERGRLAVGDFGIATVATETSVTQTGQVLGTAAYISPEQARGQLATAASDRYALACIAFELLTGTRPFSGAHPTAQARAHVESSIPSASGIADLPVSVDDVLRAGMAKDPARRPATCAAFLEALEAALDEDDAPPTTVAAPVAVSRPAPRRWWPGLAALAAIALVAGAAIAIATAGGGDGGGGGVMTSSHAATATHHKQDTGSTRARKPAPAQTQTQQQSTQTQQQSTQTQQQQTQTPQTQTQQTQQTQTPQTQQTQTQTGTQPKTDNPVALNNQGYSLILAGRPADAVTPLQRSVDAFRAQQRTGQVDYAYALYNLGNALRLAGHPAQAIPYLEERLSISNYKRGVVKKELQTAKAQAA
jgi:serine/threonine-protein kinase